MWVSAGGERETTTLEVIPCPGRPPSDLCLLQQAEGGCVPPGRGLAYSCPSWEATHQRDLRDFWGVQGGEPLRDHGP